MAGTPSLNKRPIPILMYHQIDEPPPKGSPFRSLYVSPLSFSRQMALLKALGYTGLSMKDLLPYLRGEREGKVIGITFDDGYQNNLTHAMPVLNEHGFSSTCYVVSGLLGKTNLWDEHHGIPQVPLMDAAELRQWISAGQHVGSHTYRHVNLVETDDSETLTEVNLGKAALETATESAADHFCYPYGQYDARHTRMAAEAGFVTATTTWRGRCKFNADLLELPRIAVMRSTSLLALWLKISTIYEDLRGQRNKRRSAAKNALPSRVAG